MKAFAWNILFVIRNKKTSCKYSRNCPFFPLWTDQLMSAEGCLQHRFSDEAFNAIICLREDSHTHTKHNKGKKEIEKWPSNLILHCTTWKILTQKYIDVTRWYIKVKAILYVEINLQRFIDFTEIHSEFKLSVYQRNICKKPSFTTCSAAATDRPNQRPAGEHGGAFSS